VTTFHQAGWAYAKNCLQGLAKYFPGKVVAYYEEKPDFEDPKVELRDWFQIPGASVYLEKVKRVFGADGKQPHGYDFRFDASKFCRKVFAQEAVFDEDELVFWFDADCLFHDPLPEELLTGLVKDVPFAYMGRGGHKSYTETGFLGFNTKHQDFPKFRAKYLSYFTSGKIFSQLKGWHDCIAFDHAREGIPGRNMSPEGHLMGSVIHMTVLAPYIDHLKGNRKFAVPVGSEA
jgi:hypothetical protein